MSHKSMESPDHIARPEDLAVWQSFTTSRKESVPPDISIIIPTIDEADNLGATLKATHNSSKVEIIVVDGGSSDGTVELAIAHGVRLLTTSAGRAKQMNAGAMVARGGILLFLHGETLLPEGFDRYVRQILAKPGTVAGAFRLGIGSPGLGLRLIERLANFRSMFLQLPYGDQAIFIRADRFRFLGGFPEMPIMEDYLFVQRLKKQGRVRIAPVAVRTSGRRWLKFGVLKTTLINQVVLLGHFVGIEPERLARWYRRP